MSSILGEMRAVIDRLAAAGDKTFDPAASVAANMRALSSSDVWLYPDSDEGRAACLDEFRHLVREIEGHLGSYFDLRPKQPLKIQR